ncbi:hypothetical protein V6x_38240 [Gimesia chilikensis]|uniref:Uncharacterized protein n=1 Tax=Gimesia chilikensis TaxID=2605989 RepID=A0A517WFR3_9PLAN|nr:hypothetical protein [Gimesia chilikensis]QDU04099.1 hypothetical protein V6x_38240 [Gimesia chilikensis]
MVAGEGAEREYRVFRPPKDYRNGGLFSLIFFTPIGIAWCILMIMGTPPDRHIFVILFTVTLWSVPAILSCWMLLKYRKVSLTIESGTITVQSIFSRKVINLLEVQKVCWRLFPMGLRVYTTPRETVSLTVSHFSREDQVWLIRYFRQVFPEAIQENWPLYCLHVANRFRPEKHTVVPPPGPDEILITRQRYDRILIPLILVSTIAGIVAVFTHHDFALFILPVLCLMFWFMFKIVTPREGQIQKRLIADKENRGLFVLMGCWGVLLLCFLFIQRLEMPISAKNTRMLVSTVALLPAVIPVLMRTEKKRKQLDLIKAEQAAREWEVETAYFQSRTKQGPAE